MAKSAERVAMVMDRLRDVERMFGGAQTAEGLGVTAGVLASMLAGEVEMDDGVIGKLEVMCGSVELATGFVGVDAFPGDTGESEEAVVEVDVDDEDEVEAVVAGIGGVGLLARNENWSEELERKRSSLWSARHLAEMTQFRLGLPYQQHVAALGLMAQVELVLIMMFRDTVPDVGASWSPEKRAREIDRRLARIRWVERQQEREYKGWRGVWNVLTGQRQMSGKELYQKMLVEAEGLMTLAQVGDGGAELVDEVMRFAGLEL